MPRFRLVPLLLLLPACGPRLEEDTLGGLRRLTASFKAGPDGRKPIRLEPEPGENGMLVTVTASDAGARTHVVQVVGEDGEVRFDAVQEAQSDHATTNAGYLSAVVDLNWPRSGAERLEPLEVEFGHVDADNLYVNGPLDLTVLFKSDPDLTTGTLKVALVYAGGTEQNADLVDAMEVAMAQWETLYGAVGVSLDVVETTWPEGELDLPVEATDPEYIAISEEVGLERLNVIVVESVPTEEDVLGIAGDIPGPIAATTRSGVLVSALNSAGPDGVFSSLEARLLGETMAHEAGHYLGLYHPVEKTWDRWDSLDDTPECLTESRCVTKLADYLMFPFPVCSFNGCTSQEVITEEQAAVMHRYTGID